jgi:D-3-phosphoglycerate dehydrogenase
MQKVLLVDPIAAEGIDLLKQNGLQVELLQDNSVENIKKHVVDADAILVRTSKITREIIEAGTKLKVVARHGVGVDNIDLQAASEKKIPVTNTPHANTVSVAEHVMGLMIALAKNMRKTDLALRDGHFEVRNKYIGVELEGKTLGIIGLGKIGQKVGKIAAYGFGMKVIGYDPYVKPEQLDPAIEMTSDWDRIFKESDFVSLHMPLLESTRGIVGIKEFKMMKRTAYFINAARGSVANERDLIQALQEGLIAGLGTDVYDQEPPVKDNPLFSMDNTVVTPHMAAHSHDAMIKMATHAAQGVIEVLVKKEKPSWQVNRF